jgi:hypothetical protein
MIYNLIKNWQAFLAAAATGFIFYFISIYQSPLVFGVIFSIWLVLLAGFFYWYWREDEIGLKRYLLTLLLTAVGFVGVFLIIEWVSIRLLVGVVAVISTGVIFAAPKKLDKGKIYEFKPWRRIFMMLVVLDTYLISTSVFGLNIFFQNNLPIPFWLLAIGLTLIFSIASVIIWQLYYHIPTKYFTIWILLISVIILELIWAVQLLPFGYLSLGLIVTWIWYILQLLVRFHISKRGIIWRKQKTFLVANSVLFIIFLYFLRWI